MLSYTLPGIMGRIIFEQVSTYVIQNVFLGLLHKDCCFTMFESYIIERWKMIDQTSYCLR